MTKQEIIEKIYAERNRQERLWGVRQSLSAETWLAILAEEFGEVAKAINELPASRENLKEELVQVAAVCVQILERL